MKIGFFGNNNNYPLLLAEALRRAGHEVLLVVNKASSLHRPESRDPVAYGQGYPTWLIDAAHVSEWDFMSLQPAVGPLLDLLAGCDALVLNDLGPSLLPLLDRPAVTFLTGSDLDSYADRALPDLRMRSTSAEYRAGPAGRDHHRRLGEFVERQRQGLRDSVAVNWALPGLFPAADALLAECGVRSGQVFNLQMADLSRLTVAPAPDNRVLRIFYATRLTWRLPVAPGCSVLDYKGTDVMVRGVGQFVRATGRRVELCIVKKGMHVAETEALVAQEGLAEQVVWFAEMPLQELWRQFLASDVIVEQLGGSIISMVALDAMACGRPVIGNARPEVPTAFRAADCPLCQASTAEEVCTQLVRLADDPEERHRRGHAGRAFVAAHFSPDQAAARCLERFAAAAPAPATSRSWLLRSLDEARAAGHQAALENQALHQELERHQEIVRQQSVRNGPDRTSAVAPTGPLPEELPHAQPRLLTLESQQQMLAVLTRLLAGQRDRVRTRVLAGLLVPDGALGWRTELSELTPWADGSGPHPSGLLLFEDDRLLGPAHSEHDQIRQLGGGRYSHWRSNLYFSTSDGTDPRHNGRVYTVALPVPATDGTSR